MPIVPSNDSSPVIKFQVTGLLLPKKEEPAMPTEHMSKGERQNHIDSVVHNYLNVHSWGKAKTQWGTRINCERSHCKETKGTKCSDDGFIYAWTSREEAEAWVAERKRSGQHDDDVITRTVVIPPWTVVNAVEDIPEHDLTEAF